MIQILPKMHEGKNSERINDLLFPRRYCKTCKDRFVLNEGGIGIFGFAVLNTFLIGFSAFVSKDFRFSVLVLNAVCGFFAF